MALSGASNNEVRSGDPTTRALLVALILLIAVGLSVGLGLILARYFQPPVWLDALLLAGGVLMLVWGSLLLALFVPTILRFVRCGTVDEPPISFVSPLLFALPALVALSWFGARASDRNVKSSVTLTSTIIPADRETSTEGPAPRVPEKLPEPARDYFFIPFNTDEGSSKTCSESDASFGNAQIVYQGSIESIRILIEGLKQCAVGDKKAEIDVRGFASSSGFRSCSSKAESDRLNLLLADRRRASVIAVVRRLDPLKLVNIYQEDKTSQFSRIDDMTSPRRIKDWDEYGYSTVRGNLSRRAEIVITNKGDCEPTPEPPPPPQAE